MLTQLDVWTGVIIPLATFILGIVVTLLVQKYWKKYWKKKDVVVHSARAVVWGAADIDRVPPFLFDRVWGIIKALDDREKHFNELQSRYRTMASTWLLAAFAGVGFIYFKDVVSPPVSRELVAMGIALAGAIGIWLAWLLDVLVYHELLIAGYIVGKDLERQFSWLPPVRLNIKRLTKGPAVRWYITAFYAVGIAILGALAAIVCLFPVDSGKDLGRSDVGRLVSAESLGSKCHWLAPVLVTALLLAVMAFLTYRAWLRTKDLSGDAGAATSPVGPAREQRGA